VRIRLIQAVRSLLHAVPNKSLSYIRMLVNLLYNTMASSSSLPEFQRCEYNVVTVLGLGSYRRIRKPLPENLLCRYMQHFIFRLNAIQCSFVSVRFHFNAIKLSFSSVTILEYGVTISLEHTMKTLNMFLI
jgi:hypothetical protein